MANLSRPLRLGLRGEDVLRWQRILRGAGFALNADGIFGPSTARATIELQRRHGIKADGIVGPATLRALVDSHRAEFDRPLRAGLSGKDVATWQAMLKRAGYAVKSDGMFGAATLAATRELQRRHGLKLDGIVGPKTIAALEADLPGDVVGDFDDQVGSLWSKLKKGVRSVGKIAKKVVKATGGAVSAVGRNKVFQIAMPVAAVAAHATAKPLGGKPVFKGALGKVIDAGSGFALGKAGGALGAIAKTNLGNAFVFPAQGVPALKAVSTANRLVADAKARNSAALGVIARTQALARTGHADAQRAVSLLATAARAKPPLRPPVKALPRPIGKPPVRRPPVKPAAPAASSPAATPVQGFLIHTSGAQRGRIDFTSGQWRRA